MAITYTTVSEVAQQLQLGFSLDSTTTPSDSFVETLIESAEDYIDQETGHSWRETTATEYKDIPNEYFYNTGIPIYLNHRKIRDLDTASGDKLEVWNGSEWEDYITNRTEGRNEDFWMDYEHGVLYLKHTTLQGRRKSVRITYRYGEDTIPGDIKEAARKLSAIELIVSDDRSANVSDSGAGNNITYDQRVSYWKSRIDKILSKRREILLG